MKLNAFSSILTPTMLILKDRDPGENDTKEEEDFDDLCYRRGNKWIKFGEMRYEIGSTWLNKKTQTVWILERCLSGKALWKEITEEYNKNINPPPPTR